VTLLVIDVGTTGVRAAAVGEDGRIFHAEYREVPPSSPAPGLVEFDARTMADAALAVARATVAAAGGVDAVGIANQRSSTIAWSRATGEPVGPGLGWQDLRTVEHCKRLQSAGLLVSPNSTATKAAWLLAQCADADARDVCVGTVDSWIAWTLSEGALHVTDTSNASSSGLWSASEDDWNGDLLRTVRVPRSVLPTIVDSSAVLGEATALPGAPPIAGIAGDQQASLAGQGCVRPGMAKITFGTGGMLDLCLGEKRPAFDIVGPSGCVPAVAWRRRGASTWLLEGLTLAAGSCVEWLRDGLGLLTDTRDCHVIAASCASSEGVVFVPALVGLGTPYWDYEARGALLGLSRGTRRAHIVRAVLEGVAQRAADLVESAERDSGLAIEALRIDGGMTANATFVQAVSDATGRRVDVSSEAEATTLGAAFLAGLAIGSWKGWDDVTAAWSPARSVEPAGSFDRARWKDACNRAKTLARAPS
jgi:glycerol kinase